MENRARVVTEIIEGIRSRCGRDFIVLILMNGMIRHLNSSTEFKNPLMKTIRLIPLSRMNLMTSSMISKVI